MSDLSQKELKDKIEEFKKVVALSNFPVENLSDKLWREINLLTTRDVANGGTTCLKELGQILLTEGLKPSRIFVRRSHEYRLDSINSDTDILANGPELAKAKPFDLKMNDEQLDEFVLQINEYISNLVANDILGSRDKLNTLVENMIAIHGIAHIREKERRYTLRFIDKLEEKCPYFQNVLYDTANFKWGRDCYLKEWVGLARESPRLNLYDTIRSGLNDIYFCVVYASPNVSNIRHHLGLASRIFLNSWAFYKTKGEQFLMQYAQSKMPTHVFSQKGYFAQSDYHKAIEQMLLSIKQFMKTDKENSKFGVVYTEQDCFNFFDELSNNMLSSYSMFIQAMKSYSTIMLDTYPEFLYETQLANDKINTYDCLFMQGIKGINDIFEHYLAKHHLNDKANIAPAFRFSQKNIAILEKDFLSSFEQMVKDIVNGDTSNLFDSSGFSYVINMGHSKDFSKSIDKGLEERAKAIILEHKDGIKATLDKMPTELLGYLVRSKLPTNEAIKKDIAQLLSEDKANIILNPQLNEEQSLNLLNSLWNNNNPNKGHFFDNVSKRDITLKYCDNYNTNANKPIENFDKIGKTSFLSFIFQKDRLGDYQFLKLDLSSEKVQETLVKHFVADNSPTSPISVFWSEMLNHVAVDDMGTFTQRMYGNLFNQITGTDLERPNKLCIIEDDVSISYDAVRVIIQATKESLPFNQTLVGLLRASIGKSDTKITQDDIYSALNKFVSSLYRLNKDKRPEMAEQGFLSKIEHTDRAKTVASKVRINSLPL